MFAGRPISAAASRSGMPGGTAASASNVRSEPARAPVVRSGASFGSSSSDHRSATSASTTRPSHTASDTSYGFTPAMPS